MCGCLMCARADTQVLAGANFSGYVNAYGQPYTQANLLLDSGSVRHVSCRDTHTIHQCLASIVWHAWC